MGTLELSTLRSNILGFIRHYRTPLIALIVVAVLAMFVSQKHAEVARIGVTIRSANPIWVGLALATNLLVVAMAGLSYRVVLGKLGHTQPWAWLANLHLKRHLVGTVTPVGGPASIYVFVRTLGTRGIETPDALFAAAIRSLSGYCAFMLLVAPVLLLTRPAWYIMAAGAGLLLLMATLAMTMLLLLRESCNPGWLIGRLHPKLNAFVLNARSHRLLPRDFLVPFSLAVVHNLLGVLTLYLCLLAVGYQGALTTAIVGYAIGNLFTMVAPVFAGIGVVEVTMAVALQHLGVPVAAAIAATLLFRFADLWFPFLLGLTTHASQVEHVRRVVVQAPAMAVASAAFLVMLLPFISGPLPVSIYVPDAIAPTLAVVAGTWLLLLSYALWFRKPVAQIATYGAMVTGIPILAFQAPAFLDLSLTLLLWPAA
jgi:phosphatidylglycerol lysyltransferase